MTPEEEKEVKAFYVNLAARPTHQVLSDGAYAIRHGVLA